MATLVTAVRAIMTVAALAVAGTICGPAAAAPALPTSLGSAVSGENSQPWLLFQRVYHAAVRADRAAQHIVEFDADADANSADAIAEAAQVASDAIVALAARPDGKRMLTQIKSVHIMAGPATAVGVEDGMILIVVNPAEGVAGRPSLPSLLRIRCAAGLRPRDGH